MNCKGNDSIRFWEGVQDEKCLFIDGATAYTLTSKKGSHLGAQNINDKPGNSFIYGTGGGYNPALGMFAD